MSEGIPQISLQQIQSSSYFYLGEPIDYEDGNNITHQHIALLPSQIERIRAWISELYTSPTGYRLLATLYEGGNLRFFANNGTSPLWDFSQNANYGDRCESP